MPAESQQDPNVTNQNLHAHFFRTTGSRKGIFPLHCTKTPLAQALRVQRLPFLLFLVHFDLLRHVTCDQRGAYARGGGRRSAFPAFYAYFPLISNFAKSAYFRVFTLILALYLFGSPSACQEPGGCHHEFGIPFPFPPFV